MDKTKTEKVDVLVVGAGFAGMYILKMLKDAGYDVLVVEEADGVGGTWYWNRYPGARCDVPSLEYSYGFSDELQQEWEWSSKYSTQPEILEYANHVADRFDLKRYIRFGQRVMSATYLEESKSWYVVTSSGNQFESKYCIMATGSISAINKPKFAGLDSFKGDWYLTGRWPHENVDLSGKSVGIVGTGSSGVQTIPMLAQKAKHLTVFQRTANYSIPARNRPLDPEEVKEIKNNYGAVRERQRDTRAGIMVRVEDDFDNYITVNPGMKSALEVSEEERTKEYQERWEKGFHGFLAGYTDIGLNEDANETAAEFVRSKIRETVKDPATAEILSPKNAIGCKRLCADTNYFETYNRDNVLLIDLNETPIETLVPEGIKTSDKVFELDVVVFATGFDALTGALTSIDISGRQGRKLADKWSDGPRSFLGLAVEGFPNLFTITGPGSPAVLGNVLMAIEQHVEWVFQCIDDMESSGKTEIEADMVSEDEWMDHVEDLASETLRYSCNSWYVGANVPGKKRVFMPYTGGYDVYRKKCKDIADHGYAGFTLR
ncbi:MAG: NAD(P)/FAD-dependent oxidoreductase [Dehalococcoidia bacterium]|nr:NAD(P)/FAD-dependent oxidoreductase [Dehalococcoidia bacterium]